MNILLWVIFGALSGWLASIVMKTNSSQGLGMDILLGIIGSVVGGMLFSLFGFSGVDGFNLYSLFVAVIGAVLVIYASRLFRRSF